MSRVRQTLREPIELTRLAHIKRCCDLRPAPFCPEIHLYQVPSDETFAMWREAMSGLLGHAPPYWAVPWPGGQALARYLLDNPQLVRGKTVIDFGAGGGIAAIAGLKSGARYVVAIDIDPAARTALWANSEANGVNLAQIVDRPDSLICERFDILLAGDLWYDVHTARQATGLLRDAARSGVTVLIGDLRRAHFPRQGTQFLQHYQMPTSLELEQTDESRVEVHRLLAT